MREDFVRAKESERKKERERERERNVKRCILCPEEKNKKKDINDLKASRY